MSTAEKMVILRSRIVDFESVTLARLDVLNWLPQPEGESNDQNETCNRTHKHKCALWYKFELAVVPIPLVEEWKYFAHHVMN